MRRSLRWAARSKIAHDDSPSALFGIVQGGMYGDLRQESAAGLVDIAFDGYAIVRVIVGEPEDERKRGCLKKPVRICPNDRPRYLMGVGRPEDLLASVARGIDMFDCVMPTRKTRGNGYLVHPSRGVLKIRNATLRKGHFAPLDGTVCCYNL